MHNLMIYITLEFHFQFSRYVLNKTFVVFMKESNKYSPLFRFHFFGKQYLGMANLFPYKFNSMYLYYNWGLILGHRNKKK